MEFGNPVVGGVTLVRTDVESQGFVTEVSGWRIARNGDAEFNDVTIRGNIALSNLYAPVTATYDASGGGAPPWTTTGAFVAFSGTSWGSVDIVVPASGRLRYDIRILGMNNQTDSSTLTVDLRVLGSSGPDYPAGAGWVAPGFISHSPNVVDGALIASQVVGNPSNPQVTSYNVLDGFLPGQWLRFTPFWRISSGGAASVNFPNLHQRYTVTPVV
jgi:hypothetical protein